MKKQEKQTIRYPFTIQVKSKDLKNEIRKYFKLISAELEENNDVCVYNALRSYHDRLKKGKKK